MIATFIEVITPYNEVSSLIATFIGHRKIQNSELLTEQIKQTVLNLIDEKQVDTFLFGSRSAFDELCLETVTEIKKLRPHIKRIYVRAAYPYIDSAYEAYLLKFYDATYIPDKIEKAGKAAYVETYIPDKIEKAGKAAYVERNEYMIDKADVCIFYYDENYRPPLKPATKKRIFSYQPKSGTKIAYDYAVSKQKEILNLFSTAFTTT